MGSTLRELLSLFSDVIIPVAGVAMTWAQIRENRLEKRIRSFATASDVSPEERGEFAEQCLEAYRNKFKQEIEAGNLVVRSLVYPPAWMQRADSDDFLPLEKLPVEISGTKWESPPPRAGFLPYPREGYSYHKKQFSGGKALLFNGKLFALEKTSGDLNRQDEEGRLRVTVKTGGYFDFLDTCEYLVCELAYARKIRRIKPPYSLGPASPLRCRARQSQLLDLDNRFAGIGVNNATILYHVDAPADPDVPDGRREEKPFLLLHQRSGQVAECFGAIHVTPAGSYQPAGAELRSPFNLDMANTVYREFGEELMGVEEFSHLEEEGVLEQRFRQWKVLLLGMGIEPVNTKIEVLTAMKVDVTQPDTRRMFGGTATVEGLKKFFRTNYEGSLILLPLTEENLRQYQKDARTTPAGKEILTILLDHLPFFQRPPA